MGTFNDKISAEFHPPRKWVLERALSYTNTDLEVDALKEIGVQITKGGKITCKKDFVTDLASVPRICWMLIAPWDIARALIIHDLLYKRIRQYRAKEGDLTENINAEEVIDNYKSAKKESRQSIPCCYERCRPISSKVEDLFCILFSGFVWSLVNHT